jgi:hypothetical protein
VHGSLVGSAGWFALSFVAFGMGCNNFRFFGVFESYGLSGAKAVGA